MAAKKQQTEQVSSEEVKDRQQTPAGDESTSASSNEAVTSEEELSTVETPEVEVVDDVTSDTKSTENAPGVEEALSSELNQVRQQMLRVQADFDNFRRRTRQEKEDLQQFATRKLLADLLPVVDNFDRALAAVVDDAAVEVRTGVEMVQRQFMSVLEQYGVKAMDVLEKPFDPNVHEAVMQEPADGRDPGIVVQELQKGYELHGKVLRPAMVKVTV